MPIPVACKCGQKFAAKDEMAGKAAKCPKCGTPLQIPQAARPAAGTPQAKSPAGSSLADLLDEAGVTPQAIDTRPRCPSCKEPLPPDAVLCVNCGFNLETGRHVQGIAAAQAADMDKFGLSGEAGGHGAAAKAVLSKAQRAIRDDQAEEFKMRTQGVPVWALAIAFGSLVTFGVCMSLLPTDEALNITGIALMLLPGIVYIVCNVMILVIAFSEGAKEGICCLFVPFYVLYFCCTRWKKCGRLFMIAIICSFLSGMGMGLTNVSSQFASSEKSAQPPK